jgi:hypothetical protein
MTSRPWRIPFPILRDRTEVLATPNRLHRFPVLLVLGLTTLVAGWIYLGLTLHSAAVGLDIQALHAQSARFERDNARLELKIGELGSQATMSRRAEQMGFQVRSPEYLLLDEPLPPHNVAVETTSPPNPVTR